MLTLRLQRVGKKKYPTYRLIVSEKARDTQYDCLENLGSFDPHHKVGGIVLKADRIKYWISMGAQASATVSNLLQREKIIEGRKQKSVFISVKRKAKIAEKKKVTEKPAA